MNNSTVASIRKEVGKSVMETIQEHNQGCQEALKTLRWHISDDNLTKTNDDLQASFQDILQKIQNTYNTAGRAVSKSKSLETENSTVQQSLVEKAQDLQELETRINRAMS